MKLSGLEELQRYHDPVVRDLAWSLLSPPLLTPRQKEVQWPGTAWSQRAYQSYEERLQELDQAPATLHDFLAGQRDHRLGNYFESLLGFWLRDEANSLYRLVANSLPIRVGQQTLGELDFVVRDLASGQFQHWEVAVKFYLGIRPTPDYSAWVGPGLRDRLDLKVAHLLNRQLPLAGHPAAQALLKELGVESCRDVCLLKGRLFYPLGRNGESCEPLAATPEHWRGWWLPTADFQTQFEPQALDWCLLPRSHWLVPLTPDVRIGDYFGVAELLERVAPAFDNRAIAVVGLRDGWELERGFITPPGWPDTNNNHQDNEHP